MSQARILKDVGKRGDVAPGADLGSHGAQPGGNSSQPPDLEK